MPDGTIDAALTASEKLSVSKPLCMRLFSETPEAKLESTASPRNGGKPEGRCVLEPEY
jgi:hypothetical protein